MFWVAIAVTMFGINFLFNQEYQKEQGQGLPQAIAFTLFQSITGLIVLLIINRFRFEFTPFSFGVAFFVSLNGLFFSLCSLKAFSVVNLSVYSLCSMLGGMALPSFVGILFFHEEVTVAKITCILLMCLAFAFTLQPNAKKENEKKTRGWLYCTGIFIFNGMSGVFAKIFTAVDLPKTSSAGYSILIECISIVIAGTLYLALYKKRAKFTLKTWGITASCGALNKVANYFLLLALVTMPSSVQSPLVTGGVLIVTTLLSYVTKQKPKTREIVALFVALLAIVALLCIPI